MCVKKSSSTNAMQQTRSDLKKRERKKKIALLLSTNTYLVYGTCMFKVLLIP